MVALLFGYKLSDSLVQKLTKHTHHIFIIDDERFKNFNAKVYQTILSHLIKQEKPFLTLIAHTGFGIDLAPSLAAELGIPATTDCVEIEIEDNNLIAIRQMYGGKLNAKISFTESPHFLLTVRAGTFSAKEGDLATKITSISLTPQISNSIDSIIQTRKFIEYVEAPAGEVDITRADIIVAVGRGIKEKENITLAEDLANSLGGVVACSRPIVDQGWLPKDRQVGSSGKTVKPKLYIAIGISGAFQHVMGMKNSDMIIAINKDPDAPIFNEADYGIVDDLFKVVPLLKEKIMKLKFS